MEKMKIKLVIPCLPESGNKIQNWHYHKRHRYNEGWYEEIKYAVLDWFSKWRKIAGQKYGIIGQRDLGAISSMLFPLKKARITITCCFPDKRKRDKANFIRGLKPAIDGLIKVGMIRDDDWDSIQDVYKKAFDKKNPRTEIEIEEI